jgi:uncharacterized protein YoaH (UPF0181 family)
MAHQKDTPPDVYTLWGEFSSTYRRSLVLEELTTVADFDILFMGLRLFTVLLQCAARQPDDEAKLTAVMAAGQFVDLFGYQEDLALPFRRISDALRHGAPVVKQRRRPSGGQKLLDEHAILHGYAVATVDRLIATGMSPEAALKEVAAKLRGVQSRRGQITRRTVRGWREAVQADIGHHSVAAWVHQDILVGGEGQKFASLETDAAKRAYALKALASFQRKYFQKTQLSTNSTAKKTCDT